MENYKSKVYMLSFVCFIVGASQLIVIGMLDKIAMSFQISMATAGQLVSSFSLANALGTPFAVMALAKYNRQKQLLIALSVFFVGILGTVIDINFMTLMISRAILGVGNGAFVAIAFALISTIVPPQKVVNSMANLSIGFSAALVLGVPIGRIISEQYDWRVAFWFIGILVLISMIGIVKLIPPLVGSMPVSVWQSLSVLRNKKVLVAISASFFMFVGYSTANTYVTPLLLAIGSSRVASVSTILFLLGICGLIGAKLSGILGNRIGISNTQGISLIGQGTAMLILFIFSYINIFIALGALLLWCGLAWIFLPPQNARLSAMAPESASIIVSLNNSGMQLGTATGTAVGGVVIAVLPIHYVVLVGAFFVTIAILSWRKVDRISP